MANVFISHRNCDSSDAERVAQELRLAGHDVWLDLWDINLGDSIIDKMNDGLEGSTYVVVCYSNSGIISPWMSREWMSALARQLNGCNVKIVPISFSGAKPPAILEDIKYADLASNWNSGISQLKVAIV